MYTFPWSLCQLWVLVYEFILFFFFPVVSKVLEVTDGLQGLLLSKCKTHLLTGFS